MSEPENFASDADNQRKPIDLSAEPPITEDDTNPSKSQLVRSGDLRDEPPITEDDTSPSKSQQIQAIDPRLEPTITMDDTSPSLARRPTNTPSAWQRVAGAIALLLAIGLTIGAALIMLRPQPEVVVVVEPTIPATDAVSTTSPTRQPTATATTQPSTDDNPALAVVANTRPTLAPEQIDAILQGPITNTREQNVLQVIRNPYAPFTLIPDRPRSEVIQYTVERGDTISSIAEKFGITNESVVWANPRDIVGILSPGQVINIVPEDGVLHKHTGSATIAEIVQQYKVEDVYAVIDSEYNPELRGLTPEDVPPSGAQIMIVGGEAEQINWNPTVVREDSGGGSSGGGAGSFITFAPGSPGSCGRVANPGGSGIWSPPLSNYTWMRGFTSYHTGVDLAASPGTPIKSASSGRVVFAGWNNWGYGYTVVVAHGPYTTLYGHMSAVYVGCGQDVSAGTTIGAVGNTGNSSGPHLHFEIRFNDQPQDPTISLPF